VGLLTLLVQSACSRKVELASDPVYDFAPPDEVPLGEEIPTIPDAGLNAAELEMCSERPEGDCRGENDFPCDFEFWLSQVLQECQERTGCQANDWVSVDLNDGCATALGMVEPNHDFIACIVQTLGAFRCPCVGRLHSKRFLGVSNDGCSDSGAPLLR
jgi:hypothetical protein